MGLRQKDVAKLLNIDKETVYYWEINKTKPSDRYLRDISEFLRYCPISDYQATLPEKIKNIRMFGLGMTNT